MFYLRCLVVNSWIGANAYSCPFSVLLRLTSVQADQPCSVRFRSQPHALTLTDPMRIRMT